MPVDVLDPLRVAQAASTVDPAELQSHSAQAVVAMGLALRKERERHV